MKADTILVLLTSAPLNVILTGSEELPDPAARLKGTGLGLADRPIVLPPTVRVTGKLNDAPVDVVTKTIPV